MNNLSGKVYIGQTLSRPGTRWSAHKCDSRRLKPKQYIHHAIKKYGEDSFSFTVVAMCLTQEDADATEIRLIEQYRSRDRNYGYNIAPGGRTHTHSAESKLKMSLACKGRVFTAEHREALSKARRGKAPWNKKRVS